MIKIGGSKIAIAFNPRSALYLCLASSRKDTFYDVFVAAAPDPARHALDVGCGDGRLALRLAERIVFVVGVDADWMMLAQAQQKQIAQSKANVAWVIAKAEALPFVDHAFDYVTSSLALRLTDLEASLPMIKRMVRRPGRVTIIDLVRNSGSTMSMIWQRIWCVVDLFDKSPRLYRLFGWRGMWRTFVYQFSPEGIQWSKERHSLTLEDWIKIHQRYFPGCRIENKLRMARLEWENTT